MTVSSELPVGSDQEEHVFEEEYTQLVEEGKWLSPSAFSLLNLSHCMLKQYLLFLLLCMKLMSKHLFKNLLDVLSCYLDQPCLSNALGR
jgi:hypothetical protein